MQISRVFPKASERDVGASADDAAGDRDTRNGQ
jgi:hypothetical protein